MLMLVKYPTGSQAVCERRQLPGKPNVSPGIMRAWDQRRSKAPGTGRAYQAPRPECGEPQRFRAKHALGLDSGVGYPVPREENASKQESRAVGSDSIRTE